MIDHVKGTLKINHKYKCVLCERTEVGDSESVSLDCPLDMVESSILAFYSKSTYMPVGWAHSYGIGYRCSGCKEKQYA